MKKGVVPVLRFPEFWDAGEWDIKPLGNVCSTISSGKDKIDSNGKLDLYGSTGVIGKTSNDSYHGNFILVARVGANAGLLTRANGKFGVTDNTLVIVLKASEEIDFIYYSLDRLGLNKMVFGSGQPLITGGQLKSLVVNFPSPEEQQKIADCLSSIDELITSQSQKLDALKAHKKGLMQQLFPAEGETIPKLRFPEFRDAPEWEISPLSKFVKALDAGVSVNSGDRPATSGEAGILKTSAVANGVFEPSENKVVLEGNEIQRLKESVCADTIIISRMNTPALVGANAYVEGSLKNLFLPDRLWAAKPKPGTTMRFIAFILGSVKARSALSELATGTSGSMKNITKPDILALQISAPSRQEQQKIANCLSSIDELITTQTQKLAALKTHKKGLMQQLFPAVDEVAG